MARPLWRNSPNSRSNPLTPRTDARLTAAPSVAVRRPPAGQPEASCDATSQFFGDRRSGSLPLSSKRIRSIVGDAGVAPASAPTAMPRTALRLWCARHPSTVSVMHRPPYEVRDHDPKDDDHGGLIVVSTPAAASETMRLLRGRCRIAPPSLTMTDSHDWQRTGSRLRRGTTLMIR